MVLIDVLTNSQFFLLLATGLLGLLVGSFLNVVIHRLPIIMQRDWQSQCDELNGLSNSQPTEILSLSRPRSHCPHCGHVISALENIPVLSFLMLRGRCKQCKSPISLRYPLIELLTATLSLVVAWYFGFTIACAAALLMTWALIALTFIDVDHQLLPDTITLPLLWLGLLFNLFGTFTSLHSAVIGAIAGYLSLWLVFHGFKLLTGKEGIGYGDFKLLAALGAWLGWQFLPAIVLLSSLVGAVVGISLMLLKKQQQEQAIPFGPYLAAAGWLALLWGDTLNQWYLSLAGLA